MADHERYLLPDRHGGGPNLHEKRITAAACVDRSAVTHLNECRIRSVLSMASRHRRAGESMQLYDKYGGFGRISQLVHAFYDKVLASPSLDEYFAGVEMGPLIDHQTNFLCKVLGGPDNYGGRALRAAHHRLRITPEAFAEVASLLRETLEEARVEPADVHTILGVVASVRDDVISNAGR
jgi:hemoglobin